MDKSFFIKSVVEGIDTQFDDELKTRFIRDLCDFIKNAGNDMWAENISDQVLQVFVRNVHQINVVFDNTKLRILRSDDTFDLEDSSFEHEFKDFGLACLAVTNFYHTCMQQAIASAREIKATKKSVVDNNSKHDYWPE